MMIKEGYVSQILSNQAMTYQQQHSLAALVALCSCSCVHSNFDIPSGENYLVFHGSLQFPQFLIFLYIRKVNFRNGPKLHSKDAKSPGRSLLGSQLLPLKADLCETLAKIRAFCCILLAS